MFLRLFGLSEVLASALTITVGLTVAGAAGATPIAVISGPTSGFVDQPLMFSGGGSYETDPYHSIVEYAWDMESWLSDFVPDAFGVTVSHSFPTAGNYAVVLRVMNDASPARFQYDVLRVSIADAPNSVPEPGTFTMVVLGLGGMGLRKLRLSQSRRRPSLRAAA